MADVESLLRAMVDGDPVDWASTLDAVDDSERRRLIQQLQIVHKLVSSGVETLPLVPSNPTAESRFGPGVVVGSRYQIRTFLGRGGMGEVWRAFDVKLRSDVALKVLHDQGRDSRARMRLRGEVSAARRVTSPYVCRVFDLIELEGQEVISMEYVDGVTLPDYLQHQAPLALDAASEIASQFLSGLQSIHRAGLIQRDIKPENIMITPAKRVVLMDFGLSHVGSGSNTSLVGTPAYMAPEQFRGIVNARTDIFAAGVVLAELISCSGSSDCRARIHRAIRAEPPDLPGSPWRPVLLRALAPEPARRHPTVTALSNDLEQATRTLARTEDAEPYPGLSAFTTGQAEFFFGRKIAVESLLEKLRQPGLFGVIGPSGTGKSSFVRAGLIPALPDGWRWVLFNPGPAPTISLRRAVTMELSPDDETGRRMLEGGDTAQIVANVLEWRRHGDEALIIIDQFEELFTLNSSKTAAHFSHLLQRLVLDADVHVLLCLRDDFLSNCHQYPELMPMLSDLTLLGPLTPSALRRAVMQPAIKCGYRFEDDALIDEIVGEVVGQPGALPLLAFAVALLWEGRDRERRRLTRATYRRIGGVGGALARHAEAAMETMSDEDETVVREILRNLISASGTPVAKDVDVLLEIVGDRDRATRVLWELINARLLTTIETHPNAPGNQIAGHAVRIAHDSLLESWPRLVRWQTQDADSAQFRAQLDHAARKWNMRGRPADLLWDGSAFREYQLWRERDSSRLRPLTVAFEQAMVARARRRTRVQYLSLGALLVGLLAVIAGIGGLWQRAVGEAMRAEASQLFLGQLGLEHDPTASVASALASLEFTDDPRVRRFALRALWQGPTAIRPSAQTMATTIDFSPDGRWVVTGFFGSRFVWLWPREGGPPTLLAGHGGTVDIARFGPKSDRLVSWSREDGTLAVWSVSEARILHRLPIRDRPELLFVGETTVVLQTDTIQLWSVADGNLASLHEFEGPASVDSSGRWLAYASGMEVRVVSLDEDAASSVRIGTGHSHVIEAVALAHGATRAATLDIAGNIRVWTLDPGQMSVARSIEGTPELSRVVFGRSGSMLGAVEDGRGGARLWNLSGPAEALPLEISRGGRVRELAFDPGGKWLATAGIEGMALWPILRSYGFTFEGPCEGTLALAFSPDASWFASAGWDGVIRIWSFSAAAGVVKRLPGHREGHLDDALLSLAVHPGGDRLITGSYGGEVWLVPVGEGETTRLDTLDGRVQAVAFDATGRRAAAAVSSGERADVRVWDLETGDWTELATNSGYYDLLFTPEGALITAGEEGVRLWSTSGRRWIPLREDSVSMLGSSSDGGVIAASGWQDGVTVHDLAAGTIRRLESRGVVAIDPEGAWAAVADGPTIEVVPLDGGEPRLMFGHRGTIIDLVVSPDGHYLLSVADDRSIRIWPVPTEPPVLALERDALLDLLRTVTNVRLIADESSPEGYRLHLDPFPGWEVAPVW